MLAVDLFDELTLDPAGTGDVGLACDDPELTVGSDNLVLKSAVSIPQR